MRSVNFGDKNYGFYGKVFVCSHFFNFSVILHAISEDDTVLLLLCFSIYVNFGLTFLILYIF